MRLSPLSQVRSAIAGKNRFPVTIRQIQVGLTVSKECHVVVKPVRLVTAENLTNRRSTMGMMYTKNFTTGLSPRTRTAPPEKI